MNRPAVVLEACQLHKSYATGNSRTEVLRGVSMSVRRGEVFGIIGPSGAGKSTLLHVLGGLDKPHKGSVMIEGKDLYRADDRTLSALRNKTFGFVFQFYHLLPELTVFENIMMPRVIEEGTTQLAPEAATRVTQLLHAIGLARHAERFPAELSGGEQQRVAIARALVHRPDIVLCDEPTGNLDSQMSKVIFELLVSLCKEFAMTCIIVTHNEIITQYAARVAHLKDGVLTESHTFSR